MKRTFRQLKRNQHRMKPVLSKDLKTDLQNSNDDFQNASPELENTDTMDILQQNIPTNNIPSANTHTKAKRKYVKKTTTPNPHTFTSEKLETNIHDTAPLDMQEPQRKQPHQQLINDLAGMYATIGIAVTAFDMYDGMIIIQKSVDRAKEMVNVAKHHPPFLKLLKQITKSNDYIVALSGHGLMLYAIMAHHGHIPANMVLLQQTGYADIPIVAQQTEELFEEAVPEEPYHVSVEQGYAEYVPDTNVSPQSPLYYAVPDARLGAWEVETPVGGDGQNRT